MAGKQLRLTEISERQGQILALTAAGRTIREVATELGIAYATVHVHLVRLQARGLVEAGRPTDLYRLLREVGEFLARQTFPVAERERAVELRARLAAATEGRPGGHPAT